MVAVAVPGQARGGGPEREYDSCMRALVGTARYWGPLLAAFMCLIVAPFVGAILDWLLLLLAFGLILDGATAMWERAGGTGNLTTHRQ
jgi:hypothetical protein